MSRNNIELEDKSKKITKINTTGVIESNYSDLSLDTEIDTERDKYGLNNSGFPSFPDRKFDNDILEITDNQNTITVEKEDIISKDSYNFGKPPNNFFCKIGNTYACWFDKNDEPRIVIGPHCKSFFNFQGRFIFA